MESYLNYWKQGWKFQILMLIFNISVALVLLPIALFLNLDKQNYYTIAIPVYVLLFVPLGGYLLCTLKSKYMKESGVSG